MYKLNVRPQECLCALFWIVRDGLKFIDGYIHLLATPLEIFKNTLQSVFCIGAFNGNRYCG